MYKIKLTKLSSNHSYVRTTEVVGECEELPQINTVFIMTGPPLDPIAGDTRLIATTPIKSIKESIDNVIDFKTENSHYQVEIIDE